MFLNICKIIDDFLFLCNGCLKFVSANEYFVGLFISLIVSSMWFRKYIKQKRAEAFFGFYTKLSLRIKLFYSFLEENGQLNVDNPENGNIYSLMYNDDCMKKCCPSYKKPDEKQIEIYKKEATELKNILLNTENNVYPRRTKRKDWYNNLQIILYFCEFIEMEKFNETNNDCVEGECESEHVIKCRELVSAMNNVLKAINQAKY